MGATLETFESLLKEDYKDPIIDVLNSKTLLLSRIQRNTDDIQGKYAYLPVNTGRNQGVGVRAENEELPVAGQQSYDELKFRIVSNYGRIQVSGQTIDAAATDDGAFTRAIESETRGIVRDVLRDQNRQFFGNGTGIMAARASGGAAGATTIVVDDVRRLEKNMIVDFVEVTGTSALITGTVRPTALTNNTGIKITSINKTTKTLTLETALGTSTTANTKIVRHKSASREIYGLDAIFTQSSGTMSKNIGAGVPNMGDVDHTADANEWYLANGMFNPAGAGTNRPFSFALLDEAKDIADIEGDGEFSLYLTNHAIYRRAAQSLLPDRRYNAKEGMVGKLDGGYDYVDYDGVPLCRDRDCQDNRIYCLDESTIVLFEQTDWDWMDKDGSILARVPNVDAYEATLKKRQQLGCGDKKNNVCIFDVAHT